MTTEAKDTLLTTPIQRMSRDLSRSAATLSDKEARFLVSSYYMMQDNRIRANHQLRSLGNEAPHLVLNWLAVQSETLEDQVRLALDKYSTAHPVGEWMRAQVGVGPVIAAGMLAHIDITKAPTVGHIWRFAGLDPTSKWNKGEKRPWNADLKVLCWKLGESFTKFSGRDDCYYGKLYLQRKEIEVRKNNALEFAETAKKTLEERKIQDAKLRATYESGKLPDGRIHLRAQRWAVKLFIAHMHAEWYRRVLKAEPPVPYPIAHLQHVHIIEPPPGK